MTKDFITLEYLNIHIMNILPLLNNEPECTYESNEWLVGHPFLTRVWCGLARVVCGSLSLEN